MNKTVLLIEDDEDTRDVIRYILGDHCSVVFSDPDNYSQDLIRHEPGVILLDYWLSGARGDEICKKLKQHQSFKTIPVILISAVNGLQEVAHTCSADDFLDKPFDIDDLVAKVLKWLK